jgi:hypothetical protein
MAHHVSSPPAGALELGSNDLRITATSNSQALLLARMLSTYTNNHVEGIAQGALLEDEELAMRCAKMKNPRVLFTLDAQAHEDAQDTWCVGFTAYAFDDVSGTLVSTLSKN